MQKLQPLVRRAQSGRSRYDKHSSLYLPYLPLSRTYSNSKASNSDHDEHFQIATPQEFVSWLAPPNLRPSATPLVAPGTHEWFLNGDLFHDWLSGEKRYVFAHGGVGCGKTMLLRSAFEYCRRNVAESPSLSTPFVLTFSFSSTTNRHLGLNDLLRSLLAQLSRLHPFPRVLHEIYRADTKTFPPGPPDDNDKLMQVLTKVLTGSSLSHANLAPNIYILLDALDDMVEPSQCQQATRFLNHLATLDLRNLRILVTSRSLGLANPWQSMWEQYALPADKVAEDIERYVRWTVSENFHHLTSQLQRKIIEGLTGPKQTM